MPEKTVCSPVSIKGSKVGSNPPIGLGARSNPSRSSADSVPPQPGHDDARRGSKKPVAGLAKIVGPEE